MWVRVGVWVRVRVRVWVRIWVPPSLFIHLHEAGDDDPLIL